MSASVAECKKQIARCGGLSFYPREDGTALSQLVTALHQAAHNDGHAQRMLDSWLKTRTDSPKPADLWSLAVSVPTETDGPPAGCSICHGEPHIIVTVRGVSAARRCSCARGRYLDAKDREREIQQARIVDSMVVL